MNIIEYLRGYSQKDIDSLVKKMQAESNKPGAVVKLTRREFKAFSKLGIPVEKSKLRE